MFSRQWGYAAFFFFFFTTCQDRIDSASAGHISGAMSTSCRAPTVKLCKYALMISGDSMLCLLSVPGQASGLQTGRA